LYENDSLLGALDSRPSYSRWLSHMTYEFGMFFGVAGSNNDINVLNRSSLFTDMLKGEAPNVNFMVNEHDHN
jgi:hypothetical protein